MGSRFVAAVRACLVLLPLLAAGAFAAPGEPPAQSLRAAERRLGDAPAQPVTLPDRVDAPHGDAGVLRPAYRLDADLGAAPPRPLALYLPGLLANARIEFNGHRVHDTIREPLPPRPRGAGRLPLVGVPDEFVRPGRNTIDIALAGTGWTSLSPVLVGPVEALEPMRERKLALMVLGPLLAAAVIGALALAVLLLSARGGVEPSLFGWFGAGGLLWALHTLWTLAPGPRLPQPHFQILWTYGFGLFVLPLVVFCVRLAEWRLPRFERGMGVVLGLGLPALYAADAAGRFAAASELWRLAWIGAVGVGVAAVARYALARRDMRGALLLGAGVVAFGFALRDWLAGRDPADHNPVYLTNYSGLLFFPLVGWLLVERFLQATRALERMNDELERRVADKSARLLAALDAMRRAKESAESADRAKSAFLAAASHDLRQPAHALGLYLSALRCEPLTPAQQELAARMGDSSAALDAMFEALLDVSRIDAGALVAERRPFLLAPLLHRLADEFAQPAFAKGLRLVLHAAPAARAIAADSDPLLLERILRNLLANALKYTPEGGVLLACRLRGAAPGVPGRWRLDVVDTGIGIAEADRERAFEEFVQLGREPHERAGGLGLGLSIVRRLARLLGHPLALASRVGRGTRFTLELPATAEAPRAAPARPTIGSLAGLAVAVVDDAAARDGMRALLGRWGCEVVDGDSAEAVLERLGDGASRLQALVVDHQLRDGRTGLEAIRLLRAACGAALPAIVVSGASSPRPLAELHASGFDWLTKPVAPARLRSWLAQAASAQPAPRAEEEALR